LIIKMRVIVFGRERMIKKLSVFLAREGIEVVGTSEFQQNLNVNFMAS